MAYTSQLNGLTSPSYNEKAPSAASFRMVLAGKTGRILCVADIRGDYHELNRLIREHEATAVIHTGDFGFINADSLDRMGDKILRHLLLYSPLLPPATRTQLLSIPHSAGRAALVNALNNSSIHFPLSQFPHLISGAITFPVPVFTVWGLIEDVRVLEKFRTGEYEVHNLSVLDEVASPLIEVSGLRLRLFGLGGAVAPHRMFDNGEGYATIAGGQGTMWTTALQIGELIDTAQRVYDETETRLLVCSAPISRSGILSLLSSSLKADLTISGGLHFRYPVSFNEFAVHGAFESYRNKLIHAKDEFAEVYVSVKEKVEGNMDEQQQALLRKAIEMTHKIPPAESEGRSDGTWTNTWHWVLSDASCGHLLFSVADGRVSAETKSTGLNFSHRVNSGPAPPSAPVTPATAQIQIDHRSSAQETASSVKPMPPTAPRATAPLHAAKGVPMKPTTDNSSGPLNNFSGLATRSPQSSAMPPAPNAPINASTSVNSGPPAVSAKPSASSAAPLKSTAQPPAIAKPAALPPANVRSPQQFRPSRGASSLAGQALTAAGIKDKQGDAKLPSDGPSGKPPALASTKPAAPIANGKPDAAPAQGSEKAKNANEKKAAEAAESKRTSLEDNSKAQTANNKAIITEEAGGTAPVEDEADTGHKREESAEGKASSPSKKSLYIKGLPLPTSQDELKGLFKITNVKIIIDHFTKKQKDFAYIDFESEEDLQAALASHTETIRDTKVNISISNPPPRSFQADGFRGRGRGSFRGRGGMRGGFGGGPRKESGEAAVGPSNGGERSEAARPSETGGW